MMPPTAASPSLSRSGPLVFVLIGLLLGSCDRVPGSPQGEHSLIDPSPDVSDIRGAAPNKAAGGGMVLPYAFVDDSPAWSPDGRWIAFHRAVPSQYGPPGLYITSRDNGSPRLLLQGNALFPREVSFSPDGRRLVCNAGNQLVLVDLTTGQATRPMFTDNGAIHPDWSSNGRDILYQRASLRRFPPEPVDSAGLHIFDIESGVDRPLWSGFGALPAGPSKWIRNGRAVAVLHGDAAGYYLSAVALDGAYIERLASVPFPKWLANLQRIAPARPRAGPLATETIVALVFGEGGGQLLEVTTDPIAVTERMPAGLWDTLSPTGQEVVAIAPDPAYSLGVLFLRETDASPHAKMRQVTQYDPP